MKTESFEHNGYIATVVLPDEPNGKWIWKTEFLYAFDQAERALFDMGYTRVYYQISDMYGSDRSVRLMREFHRELLKRYSWLDEKTILFGFSRGALYAFNYALFYPESVSKIYFDAPVLNLKSWPKRETAEFTQFLREYNLCEETLKSFKDSPKDRIEEFSRNGIPILIVAGDSDATVPYKENGKLMVDYYKKKELKITVFVKKGCGHHPHSLEDVNPIVTFVE